jgi:queuine tRNA-ribosyltransferase
MSCEVVVTRGGARAILDHATGEVMHPIVGPKLESQSAYLVPSRLSARLAVANEAPFVLFDIGLGGGSLAIAAWHLSESLSADARRLEIVSFDHDRSALALALTFPEDFSFEDAAGEAARTLLREGEHVTPRTRWRFIEGELPTALSAEPEQSADMIYWDAFSPKRNPELWTVAAFRAARRCANVGAALHTYSGATATRSALILAGFEVGLGAAVGAGKVGSCGVVPPARLDHPLDARWLERLARSSAPFPADAPTDALKVIAGAPQFAADGR